jgi:phasin family protein
MPAPKTTKTTAASAPIPAPAAKKVEPVVAVNHKAVETVVKASTEAVKETVSSAVQTVEKTVKATKGHVDAVVSTSSAAAFKGYEEIVQFGKDNVEALVKSNSIAALGLQDLSRTVATLVQATFEESVAASKTLFGAKSLKEVMDLSSTLAKSNIDKLVTESSKISKASAKLAEEALAPVKSRVEAVVEKFIKTAA